MGLGIIVETQKVGIGNIVFLPWRFSSFFSRPYKPM